MIKKNKRSTSYLNHPLNNSPSKTAVKFGHEPRFIEKKKFSPDKFYQIPDTREKRATSFGYGSKVDFTQEHIGDPAKYIFRTEFDQICQGYRYGVRPPSRQLPKELLKDKSADNLKRKHSTLLLDLSATRNSPNSKKKSSVQTSSKKEKERPILQNKQALQNSEQPKQKKSAYRLKYEYSNSYLVDNKKTSYFDFIKEKKEYPSKNSISTFGMDDRWKRDNSFKKVGPGSYNRFSQFGENQNAY